MNHDKERYLLERPQTLCKMCGKCCRVATTMTPYSKLVEMKNNGDSDSTDFLDIFEPYSSIDEARKVDALTVDNIINSLLADDNVSGIKNLTFYKCKFLADDNKCKIYEDRKTLCKHFPVSPWAIVPPGCGFEGWLFMKREETKQKIRKVKEDLIELQLLKNKIKQKNLLQKIEAVEQKMYKTIEGYKSHGSLDW